MIINKKILLYSLLAGLAFGASRSWPMEAEETNPAGDIAKARARLKELLKDDALFEKIKRDFSQNYIYNFRTQYNRDRLEILRKTLQHQQETMEKRLQYLELEQEALELYVQTECTGEAEKDKICALQ